MPIDNLDEFHADKADYLTQTEAANKRTEEANAKIQEITLDKQLSAAYNDAGGIGNDADPEAYEAIKRHLKDSGRLQFEKGEPVFIGEDGQPKPVAEIIAELKQHPAYKLFFSAVASNSQADSNSQQQNGPKTYSRDDARTGKASMNDIASGKALVENTSGKPDWVPDTKRVNAGEIAKVKDRRWK